MLIQKLTLLLVCWDNRQLFDIKILPFLMTISPILIVIFEWYNSRNQLLISNFPLMMLHPWLFLSSWKWFIQYFWWHADESSCVSLYCSYRFGPSSNCGSIDSTGSLSTISYCIFGKSFFFFGLHHSCWCIIHCKCPLLCSLLFLHWPWMFPLLIQCPQLLLVFFLHLLVTIAIYQIILQASISTHHQHLALLILSRLVPPLHHLRLIHHGLLWVLDL